MLSRLLVCAAALAALAGVQLTAADCSTAAAFEAKADSLPGDPSRVIISLPSDTTLATQLADILTLSAGNGWSVSGSVKMDPKYGALKSQLTFDQATGVLTVHIGDSSPGSASHGATTPAALTLAATTALASSTAAEGRSPRIAAAAAGAFAACALSGIVEAADACNVEGTVTITYPSGFMASMDNRDLSKGPISYIVFRTSSPTRAPTPPTASPTAYPTNSPTKSPTWFPSVSPTKYPSASPTTSPTKFPSASPTKSPSKSPTKNPTNYPTASPTQSPTFPFKVFVNEVELATPTKSFEVVVHRDFGYTNLKLVYYGFLGISGTAFYQDEWMLSEMASTDDCGGKVKILTKTGVSVANSGPRTGYVAILDTTNDNAIVHDRVFGINNNATIILPGGPLDGQFLPVDASFSCNNDASCGLKGSGINEMGPFKDLYPTSFGSANPGQVFCP